jgi:hypothetical protein
MHSPILADAGIPMIFIQFPAMLCALIPVIFVEAFVVHRSMPLLSYRRTLGGLAAANAASTLAGVPLAWGAMLALEFITLFPLALAAERSHSHWFDSAVLQTVLFPLEIAWLGPLSEKSAWVAGIALALLLIPCFFVSVWLERWICRRLWRTSDRQQVNASVFRANLLSYALLLLLAFGWSAWLFYHARR